MSDSIFRSASNLFTSADQPQAALADDSQVSPLETLPSSPQERFQSCKAATLERLKRTDLLIAEDLALAELLERRRTAKVPSKVVEYDEAGNLLPPRKSLLAGGTLTEGMEYMKAIRARYNKP